MNTGPEGMPSLPDMFAARRAQNIASQIENALFTDEFTGETWLERQLREGDNLRDISPADPVDVSEGPVIINQTATIIHFPGFRQE